MRYDLTEEARRRADRNAGLSGVGFNVMIVALVLVAAFCALMIATHG